MATTTPPRPPTGSPAPTPPPGAAARALAGYGETADARQRRRQWLWGWVAAMVVARLVFLGEPLGLDEGGFAYVGHAMLTARDPGTNLYGDFFVDRPPLMVLLYGVAGLAGTVGVRLLGMAAAVALVTGVARAARHGFGPAAERYAVPIAAALSAAPAIRANLTYSELLGAGFAAWSVGLLIELTTRGAHMSRPRARCLSIGAGVFAACGALCKQSIVDGFAVALALLLLALAVRRSRVLLIRTAWFGVGAAAAVGATFVWAGVEAHGGAGAAWHAIVTFRQQATVALRNEHLDWSKRLGRLTLPGLGAAMPILLPLAVAGVARRGSAPRAVRVAGAVWLVLASVALLGGGSYWSHYWIGLIAPVAVLAGHVLAHLNRRWRRIAVVAIAACLAGSVVVMAARDVLFVRYNREHTIASFITANDRQGDTIDIVYARANILWYTGLPAPYPYQWSLIQRALPDAHARYVTMLESAQRPTWIVQWNATSTYGLDDNHEILHLLRANYRQVTTVCGQAIWLRDDDHRPLRHPRPGSCVVGGGLA